MASAGDATLTVTPVIVRVEATSRTIAYGQPLLLTGAVTGAVPPDDVLGTYGLVHDGPVKGFHDRVLAEVGLL